MSADESAGATMAATNGERSTATPDPSTLATPGKRKRVSSHDDMAVQETSASSLLDERTKLQETLHNLVDILSKNDTELQLLSCPLPSSPVKPRSKRAKISGDKDEAASIQDRVASDRYNTLSEFLSDIEKASAAVIERNKTQASGAPTDGTPVTETVNRIAAFKKLLNSLVRQAHVSPASIKAETPGNETEVSEKQSTSTEEARNNGLVLTLFGNPANPKQLYSSLQKSVKVPLSSDESESNKYVEVQTPLPEAGLPNGITTTKVTPYDSEKPKVTKRTFGDVFTPKSTLPLLEPPRRARASSRTSQVPWIDPFDTVTNYRNFLGDRNNYSFAQLPSGNWLQYGGVTSSPSFWGRRQKQQPSQQHSEEKYHEDPILWPDEDASMLQGVYSSFAPTFDSSSAVVQADSKNLVWWTKRGAKRLDVLLSISDEDETSDTTTVQPGSIGDLDESTLEEMVKSFNPEDFADASIPSGATGDAEEQEEKVGKTPEEKDTDDLLADVSDLLETLSSYQRIRNLELPLANQSAEAKDTPSTQTSPDKPSDAELDVYETLRSSLSVLVSQLPPFAVAKLNGDQLADLNISQKILVENTDYPGSMEKDDHTVQQERAAVAAAAPAPNRTSTPSRPSSYQPPYNQRAFNVNARVQPPGSFQSPQPYYPPRQPSNPGTFTPGNPQPFPGARPPATPGQRPAYFPGYGQSTPQFNQGNPVPQYQRQGQNGYNPYTGQPGPNSAQGSPQQYNPRPGQPAPYNVTPYGPGRSASPQKPPAYATPRGPFMPPGSTPQQRFMQHPQPQPHQQSTPYGNYAPNQNPNAYSNSAAAMTYARSAAEQAALMDRNKVQLAAQGSPGGTPQSQPVVDHRSSQDRSVTPGNKQNGTPVPT